MWGVGCDNVGSMLFRAMGEEWKTVIYGRLGGVGSCLLSSGLVSWSGSLNRDLFGFS